MERLLDTGGEHPDELRYTPAEALAEADEIRQLANERTGGDLDEAEWLTDLERFRQLEYLELKIEADLAPLIERINADFDLQLAPRPSGFHLTIVSPPERKSFLTASFGPLAKLRAAREALRDGLPLTVRGLGLINAERRNNLKPNDQDKSVLYLAVDAPELQALRRALNLPPREFHITLGFVGGDVHRELEPVPPGQKAKDRPILKRAEADLEAYAALIPDIHVAGFISGPNLEHTES